MKRILFIASKPFSFWRGPSIRVSHDLLALSQLGYEVDFLTVPVGAPDPIPGVRILRVPNLLMARTLPEGRSLRTLVFNGLLFVAGLSLAWRNPYAVVHGFDDAGVVAWLVARASRASVIFEMHATPVLAPRQPWQRLLAALCSRVERWVRRHSDVVIGAGPDTETLTTACNGRVCRIPDVPSALEAPPNPCVSAWRARFAQDMDSLIVTCVASFAKPRRDLTLLFDTVPRVRAEDARIRFVVVGGTPHEIRRQQRDLKRQGCADAVFFAGCVTPTDLSAILSASDILAAPSPDGTHAPTKVLDYLHSGTAIVATNCAANRDVLSSETAVLTPPDPKSFAAGILSLCRNPPLRYGLGRRGREWITRSRRFDDFRESLRACYTYVGTRRNRHLGG